MQNDLTREYYDDLARIKRKIRNFHDYFKDNYDRYNEFRKFVFDTTLQSEEITLLQTIQRPQLEFNVVEAYISRLLGEFSKQEPDILVSAYDQDKADPLMIRIIQEHLRHVFDDQDNKHTRYELYKDLLSGGFSVLKVVTDYEHPMSMNQVIKAERVEPTLCGFDKLAKYSHKGDGNFCYQLFPKDLDDFIAEYPDTPVSSITAKRDFAGFNWSYLNDNTKIIIVADYYEKIKKEESIIEIRDIGVMTTRKYRKMLDEWDDITVPPQPVGKSRKTMTEKIVRYRMIENQIIEREETDFQHLPLIFVDGNSALIKTPKNGNIRQVTRPYVYHARDAQRLKNYAGISLANELENMLQSKWKVAKEAIPKEEGYQAAFKQPQLPNVIVYNSLYENDPDKPINNPISEVNRVPAPPEIFQAFTGTDSLMQNILGSYDASLGINNNQLSGIAIVEGASQSNSTAMPFIVGCLQGLQRFAQIYVDLMPKYYTTPRTLPIQDDKGQRHFILINQPNGLPIDFQPHVMNVSVTAGASFQVQKSRTIMMVKEMMGMSPLFSQFMSEKGLQFILDNMEGKGVEQLKALVDEWTKQYQQEKQQAMQAQQQNPQMMKVQLDAQKLKQQQADNERKFAIDSAKLQTEQEKIFADLHLGQQEADVQLVKAHTERFAKEVDLELKRHDMHHRHNKEHRDEIRTHSR